jgi:regulator of RNase E activity RraA
MSGPPEEIPAAYTVSILLGLVSRHLILLFGSMLSVIMKSSILNPILSSSGARIVVAIAIIGATFLTITHVVRADIQKTAAEYTADPVAMVDAYRHVEAASVSDAIEQLLHEKRYMSHRMQSIFPTKFAGTALTVKLVKQENHEADALTGMLKAIDSGGPGSVYVMQVEDGADIAGMGGLMGTAMFARGFAGAVIDGGVRDLPQLKKIGFPVYATGSVPSTSVGHYRFGGMNVPVDCDGVKVAANDIIVADQDGVVVVPRDHAAEVLILAQKLDNSEHSMYPFIEKFHSIEEAVKQFGRI